MSIGSTSAGATVGTVMSVSEGADDVTAGLVVRDTVAGYSAYLEAERLAGRSVGVVLTMGALHDGHGSLIRQAAAECDTVAVSVFVNPTQFGEVADLVGYPRTLEADLQLAHEAGASVVFAPSITEMYPGWPTTPTTTVTVRDLGRRWEGETRPGHFDGMATVVVKLLAASGRCRTYFGEKDFQQLAIVRRVVHDLNLPVEVVGCATVRESDGLAMSSRNVRLDADGRAAALCLSRALTGGVQALAAGAGRSDVERAMTEVVSGDPLATLGYAVLVYADDLEPADDLASDRPLRLLVAVTVGPVRLIDNLDPRGAM